MSLSDPNLWALNPTTGPTELSERRRKVGRKKEGSSPDNLTLRPLESWLPGIRGCSSRDRKWWGAGKLVNNRCIKQEDADKG